MAFFKPPIRVTTIGDASTINGKSENQLSVASAEDSNTVGGLFPTEIPLLTNTTWVAAGDLLVGSGTGIATILSQGDSGKVLTVDPDLGPRWMTANTYAANSDKLDGYHETVFSRKYETVLRLEDMSLSGPPEYPAHMGIYMVNGTGTGAWASFEDKVLIVYNAVTETWAGYLEDD